MATTIPEYKYRIKEFFRFSGREKIEILITILAMTLIFAYNDRRSDFVMTHWISNFLIHLFAVAVAVLLHISVQKIAALWQGFRAEYRMWTMGTVIGLLVMFLSGGKWYIILPGGVFFYHLAIQRLGHFRYGLGLVPSGIVAAMGPLANLVLATFWETLALNNIAPEIFHRMTFINLYYAFFSMLPIPNMDGVWLMFGSRLFYMFFFGILLGYIILYTIGVYSLIWSIILGGVTWFLFYLYFERKVKGGTVIDIGE